MRWTKEYKIQYFKQYHLDHKEHQNQLARQYYLDHKEDIERIQDVRRYRKKYNLNHKTEIRQKNKQYRRRYKKRHIRTLKQKLIMIVQGDIKCSRCPETDIRKLSFDHILCNGDKDRKRFLSIGGHFVNVRWKKYMIKHYPEEKEIYPLQVLCRNCHEIKSIESGDYINNKCKVLIIKK